jgi:hypothetical protein
LYTLCIFREDMLAYKLIFNEPQPYHASTLSLDLIGVGFVLGLELESWSSRSEEHFAIDELANNYTTTLIRCTYLSLIQSR